jgi:predicted nucleotidyltransferase
MTSKTETISKLIRECIRSVDANTEVILFGSRARGDEHEDSDWDILVLTEEQEKILESKIRDKLFDLELETGEPFSLFVYSKSDWQNKQKISPFYHHVNREGIWL